MVVVSHLVSTIWEVGTIFFPADGEAEVQSKNGPYNKAFRVSMLTSQGHPRNLEGLPLLTLSIWNLASKESRGGYVGVGGGGVDRTGSALSSISLHDLLFKSWPWSGTTRYLDMPGLESCWLSGPRGLPGVDTFP